MVDECKLNNYSMLSRAYRECTKGNIRLYQTHHGVPAPLQPSRVFFPGSHHACLSPGLESRHQATSPGYSADLGKRLPNAESLFFLYVHRTHYFASKKDSSSAVDHAWRKLDGSWEEYPVHEFLAQSKLSTFAEN
jgi:hypothetical protein